MLIIHGSGWNRVTLLLAHSQDQTVTQKKIEAYLSAAPNLLSTDDDPKGVVQRVKLVELYILHVLPRVGDWEYAREFTHMSGDLDDEQKEVHLAQISPEKSSKYISFANIDTDRWGLHRCSKLRSTNSKRIQKMLNVTPLSLKNNVRKNGRTSVPSPKRIALVYLPPHLPSPAAAPPLKSPTAALPRDLSPVASAATPLPTPKYGRRVPPLPPPPTQSRRHL